METGGAPIDYKTHILIGVRTDGVMSIIEEWAHLPTQTDVQEAIDSARGSYANFALCTPTSILPGKRGADEIKRPPFGFVPPRPMRRP